jgi:A/G-specific adenine glycosylase
MIPPHRFPASSTGPKNTQLTMARTLTIISGGQTGVDRAALDAALQSKIPIDGWCPRGRLAEDGVLPERYALRETPSARYPERTEWNVRDSEGTLLLPYGRLLGGTGLTAELAKKHGRPTLRLDLADPADRHQAASKILAWMWEAGITRLNVAGPRGSSAPEVYQITKRILLRLIVIWKQKSRSLPDKPAIPRVPHKSVPKKIRRPKSTDLHLSASGDEGSRTLDLSIANAALCQLSYVPGLEPAILSGDVSSDKTASTGSAPWPAKATRTIRRELPKWFARFGRELPWRQTRDPYPIWVSEIMLQQTTVAAVGPFYERFLARFPDVQSLAMASEEEVLRLWEGLGYYSRGRNLRTAAIIVCDRHGGRFPETVAGLRSLPGIGRYVAGAVASFAFGIRSPIVEANTLRLYCRLLGYSGDPRNAGGQQVLWAFAESILPTQKVGNFNQALMDLGSMICTPKNPDCPRCPLKTVCRALASGTQHEIPQKATRPDVTDVTELTVAVMAGERVFIRRRSADERWAGLWDFPRFACEPGVHAESRLLKMVTTHLKGEYDLKVSDVQLLIRLKHSVTRYRIDLRCYVAQLSGEAAARLRADEAWVERETLEERPMSVTGRKFAIQLGDGSSDSGVSRGRKPGRGDARP